MGNKDQMCCTLTREEKKKPSDFTLEFRFGSFHSDILCRSRGVRAAVPGGEKCPTITTQFCGGGSRLKETEGRMICFSHEKHWRTSVWANEWDHSPKLERISLGSTGNSKKHRGVFHVKISVSISLEGDLILRSIVERRYPVPTTCKNCSKYLWSPVQVSSCDYCITALQQSVTHQQRRYSRQHGGSD